MEAYKWLLKLLPDRCRHHRTNHFPESSIHGNSPRCSIECTSWTVSTKSWRPSDSFWRFATSCSTSESFSLSSSMAVVVVVVSVFETEIGIRISLGLLILKPIMTKCYISCPKSWTVKIFYSLKRNRFLKLSQVKVILLRLPVLDGLCEVLLISGGRVHFRSEPEVVGGWKPSLKNRPSKLSSVNATCAATANEIIGKIKMYGI